MRLSKKQIWPGVVILTAAIIIAGGFYINQKNKHLGFLANNYAEKTPVSLINNLLTREPIPLRPQKALASGLKTLALPILMYHHVGSLPPNADAITKDLTVPTSNFQNQVAWVKSQGYNTISLEDIYLYSQGKFTMLAKPIVFTFDDGYADVFQNAVPILQQYGYIGSFGIITNDPGATQGTNIYATWSAIKSASQKGMEIVCHTQNHFDGQNPKYSADYILSNLNGCKSSILNNLETSTNILIYPYGHYTPVYLQQAKAAGFVMGVTEIATNVVSIDDLMEIPRVRVHSAESLQRFEDSILGKFQQTYTGSGNPDGK